MGLRDRLNLSRNVQTVDLPATQPGTPVTDLFAAVYGTPDPSKLRRATTITVHHGADVDAHLRQPLTDAQREGVRAQARVEGIDLDG